MIATKFFRLIWRFNAIVLAIAGMLAIVVLTFASYFLIKNLTRTRTAHDIVNLDPNQSINEEWGFGYLQKICNTSYAVLPLESRQRYALNISSGKEAASVRNLLFVDTAGSTKRWLLRDNTALILRRNSFDRDCSEANETPADITWYEIVKADTDKNGRMDDDDKTSVALSRLDGTALTEVVTDADQILGRRLVGPQRFIVFFEKDKKAYLSVIETSSLKVLSTEVIQALPAQD